MNLFADIHIHTVASTHALSTVTENIDEARKLGLKCIAITDHSVDMPDGAHLWHFYTLGNIPRCVDGVYVLRGIEADFVNFNGDIDIYDYQLYDMLDWIIASYHHPVCMPGTKSEHTQSYINALSGMVDCIGHPDTADFIFDYEEVCKCCKAYDKVIEVNNQRCGNPGSREVYIKILEQCAKHGAKVIVNSDAHYHVKLGRMDNALSLLEEIGFPEELVVNADWDRFKSYINGRKGKKRNIII